MVKTATIEPSRAAGEWQGIVKFVIRRAGVIGLGNKGHALAVNLVEDGYQGARLRQKSRAHNGDGVDRRDGTRAVLISSMMLRTRAAAASGRNDRRLGLSQGVRKLLVQVQVHFQKIARRQRQPLIQ